MQGIAALPTDMTAPAGGAPGISTEEAATLGRLLMKVSNEEVDQLRELSDDLKEFTGPELKDFLGGIDYIMSNAANYKQAVMNLTRRGIVEPGDLPAEYIAHVVRNGLLGMPPLRPTDVTEAELERLVQYVRSTPADKIPAEHPGGAYTKAPTLEEIWVFGIRPRLFTVILPAIAVLVAVIVLLLRRRKR